jgi:hypothetical protein
MVGIFGPACELLAAAPMDEGGTILVHCCPSTLSLTPPPLSQTKCAVYRQCVAVGGGGVLNCVEDHILQEFYTLFLTSALVIRVQMREEGGVAGSQPMSTAVHIT